MTMTPTPTLDYYVEMTTPGGAPAHVEVGTSVADYWIILLLFAILFSIWLMYILNRLKEGK